LFDPRLTEGFRSQSFPCNPIPFALGLAELVREKGTDDMTTKQAHQMLLFHQRAARAMRKIAQTETRKRWRNKLLDDAHSADMMAAEYQAVLQVARMGAETP